MKFIMYQMLVTGLVWFGMLFYIDDLYDQGMIIFYVVTSWFLFLIVLFVKEWLRSRNKQEDDEE